MAGLLALSINHARTHTRVLCKALSHGSGLHTDLVETALVREDGNVSVVACASYRAAVSIYAVNSLSAATTHQT